eukprot:Hpha_TRINITY_DN15031_c0_g1::TRINITY_DN15031_c0_g1_i3::g.123522::m.123522
MCAKDREIERLSVALGRMNSAKARAEEELASRASERDGWSHREGELQSRLKETEDALCAVLRRHNLPPTAVGQYLSADSDSLSTAHSSFHQHHQQHHQQHHHQLLQLQQHHHNHNRPPPSVSPPGTLAGDPISLPSPSPTRRGRLSARGDAGGFALGRAPLPVSPGQGARAHIRPLEGPGPVMPPEDVGCRIAANAQTPPSTRDPTPPDITPVNVPPPPRFPPPGSDPGVMQQEWEEWRRCRHDPISPAPRRRGH